MSSLYDKLTCFTCKYTSLASVIPIHYRILISWARQGPEMKVSVFCNSAMFPFPYTCLSSQLAVASGFTTIFSSLCPYLLVLAPPISLSISSTVCKSPLQIAPVIKKKVVWPKVLNNWGEQE